MICKTITFYHILFRYATHYQTLSGAFLSWRRRKHVQPGECSRIFYVSERRRGIAVAGKLEKLENTSKQVVYLYMITYYRDRNFS